MILTCFTSCHRVQEGDESIRRVVKTMNYLFLLMLCGTTLEVLCLQGLRHASRARMREEKMCY